MWLGDLLSNSVTFVPPSDLPSTPVNFPCGRETFRKLSSASLLPGDVLSTSVNFPYCQETFNKYFVRPEHLQSTFRAVCITSSRKTTVYLRQLYLQLELLPTFFAVRRPSINCRSSPGHTESLQKFMESLRPHGS